MDAIERHRPARAAWPWSPTPPRRWARAMPAGRSPRGATRARCRSTRRRTSARCGDGGMVLTTRDDVAERVRLLRDHGAPRQVRARRARLLEPARRAAGRAAAREARAPGAMDRGAPPPRRALPRRARRPALGLPVERPPARHVYHQFTVRVPGRDALAAALAELGVGTSVHYPTISRQPLFSRPGAERASPKPRGRRARCSRCRASRSSPTRRSTRWRRRAPVVRRTRV